MSEAEQDQKQWVVTGSEGNGEYFQHEWYIDCLDGEGVAVVNGEANVRRFAAAPEMLEALEMVVDRPDWQPLSIEERQEVYDAISKAKGRHEPTP